MNGKPSATSTQYDDDTESMVNSKERGERRTAPNTLHNLSLCLRSHSKYILRSENLCNHQPTILLHSNNLPQTHLHSDNLPQTNQTALCSPHLHSRHHHNSRSGKRWDTKPSYTIIFILFAVPSCHVANKISGKPYYFIISRIPNFCLFRFGKCSGIYVYNWEYYRDWTCTDTTDRNFGL